MKKIAIVAAAENRVIGRNNQIPWRLRNDLRYFKRVTLGHDVLMGRKSFESLGKPLKGRDNLVISRSADEIKGVELFRTIDQAIHWSEEKGSEILFITGGGEIYRQTMDQWDELYMTEVHASPEGDVYFPEVDLSQYELYYSEFFEKSEQDEYDFTIKFYRRKK
jgi:dihydrofolate reductase